MYQAEIAVRDILGLPGPAADCRALPRVTFTDPEVGSVGLSEHAAREQGLRARTGTARVPSSARGWIHKASNHGLIKLVEDSERGVLVGATSAGPTGGEVLYGLAVAVHSEDPRRPAPPHDLRLPHLPPRSRRRPRRPAPRRLTRTRGKGHPLGSSWS
ncbi:hypothetical protein [Streptomyces flavidovirens]|uniref:hypothetical protein n=1 Tax=Streptomyces flavidovirens TaxID=67298 RepID=UPI001FCC4F64|nr:hypothetical protein [Streptomyces flavidovirens]